MPSLYALMAPAGTSAGVWAAAGVASSTAAITRCFIMVLSRRSFQKGSRAGFAGEPARVDDDLAARDHGVGHAGHFATFVRVVVDAHVQRLDAESELLLRIEDDNVGVGAGRD